MTCTIHKVLGIIILMSCFGCPQSSRPITAGTSSAPKQKIQDKVNEEIPWRLTEGLRAKWIYPPFGDSPTYVASITVLAIDNNVKIRLLTERGGREKTKILSLHESAVPVAVAASYWKFPVPHHRVKWTQHPSRPDEWSADLVGYVVSLTTRTEGPPSIFIRIKALAELTSVPPYWRFEPVHQTDTDEPGE